VGGLSRYRVPTRTRAGLVSPLTQVEKPPDSEA
jgi:hypothetical protein